MGLHPLGELSLGKRGFSDQQVVEGAAKRVDVATAVGRMAIGCLLGGQVVGRAEHPFVMLPGDRGSLFVVAGKGQPEVEDFDRAFAVEHQV